MTRTDDSKDPRPGTAVVAPVMQRRRPQFRLLGWLFILAVVAGAFLAGRYLAPRASSSGAAATASGAAEPAATTWTCSMHPQIRLSGPGNCPICEMPLIPAGSGQSGGDGSPMLTLSNHAIAMASVETVPVVRREVSNEIRAVGKVEYSEWSLATVTMRVGGYAEKLFVNFTGVEIKAGNHLAEVYSPELVVAQEELLITQRASGSSQTVKAAKVKLRRWGLTEQQIEELVQSQKITERITLYSPINGTVIEKSIVENSAFEAGDALYRVANLDTVWVYLDIYEFDLAWVRYGQSVELTAEAYPGRIFSGMVTFVQPVLNEQTRTVRVPVHVENHDHVLKPGMYLSAVIKAALGPNGQAAPTGVEGKFSCPMHPQVLRDELGACPLCEMPLEKIPGEELPPTATSAVAQSPRYFCPMKCEGEKTYDQPGRCPVCNMKLKEVALAETGSQDGRLLVVPVTAVLDSGTRRIVYVEKGGGTFEPREVTAGPRSGEFVPVLKGVEEGERVVMRGGFLIDSQFQVTGHSSLFYPGGLHAAMGHQHGDAGASAPEPTPTTALSEPAGHKL